MKICTCETCRYIFRYPIIPSRCPDCGKDRVRRATSSEVSAFRADQKILAEEIRAGLYGTAAV